MYYASLQTEEGQFIKVTATLIDINQVKRSRNEEEFDKWEYFPFGKPLELNIKNLVKLSKAADPWSSSLAIYHDQDGTLLIYGMIDQALHYQSHLNYEREHEPAAPGIIQAMVNGIGIINVMLDYDPLATLNQYQLVRSSPNVFKLGPVADFLREHAVIGKQSLRYLGQGEQLSAEEVADMQELLFDLLVETVCRVLLKIKNYHHGGAVLITNDFVKNLDIKYPISYDRISMAILHMFRSLAGSATIEEEIEEFRKDGKDKIPFDLHEVLFELEDDVEQSYDEMSGAVRFVSSLSCVDGLVLLSTDLTVNGFGAVIIDSAPPDVVYINPSARISDVAKAFNAKHFGTRHRSMFAYCAANPDSLGFVISQDGEIRAIKSVGGKIYLWENIKVYQFKRSKKLPRKKTTKS